MEKYIERLRTQTMIPAKIEHIKGAELPPFLHERFNVKPQQFLKITVEVEDEPQCADNKV